LKPQITLRNISKKYGGEYILRNISLDIMEGDYIVIMGRSGVGKTSLLRIISLLTPPDEGEMHFMDWRVDWEDEAWRAEMRARYLGTLYQGEILISTLTAYENIALAYRVKHRAPDNEEIRRYMELLGVAHLWDRYPESYSAGEYRRIGIIRALVADPKILVLDEPYANLSSDYIQAVDQILHEKNSQGTTIIMTTTELDRGSRVSKKYLLEYAMLKPVL